MSEIQRTSFTYDPARQGYDTNSWRTISGVPAVTGAGRFIVDAGAGTDGAAVHYADFLKGDISFNINVPAAPAAGDSRYFGVSAPSGAVYIRFAIAGGTFTCQTSDGITTTNSAAITWDSNWSGANIEYRILWEGGTAKFIVNGSQQYAVSDVSVPNGALSLYLFDNSSTAMTIGDINVRGTQSFVMNPKTSDTTANILSGGLSRFENVTITESIAFLLTSLSLPYVAGTLFESVTVSENITMLIPQLPPSLSETVTITEDVVVKVTFLLIPSVFDSVTITENFQKGIFG